MRHLLTTVIAALTLSAPAAAFQPIFIEGGEGGGAAPKMMTQGYVKAGRMTERDYPDEALRNELTGRVRVSFIIHANGRTSDCRIVRTSSVPILDTTTCRIVETRYVVEPPRDEAGQPILGRAHQYVTWQLAG